MLYPGQFKFTWDEAHEAFTKSIGSGNRDSQQAMSAVAAYQGNVTKNKEVKNNNSAQAERLVPTLQAQPQPNLKNNNNAGRVRGSGRGQEASRSNRAGFNGTGRVC